MNELKTIAPYVIGGTIGYFLKDTPGIEAYGFWILPLLYLTMTIVYVIGLIHRFRNRTFIASKFDRWGRFITLTFGISMLMLAGYSNFILYFGNGLVLLLGVIATISGLFYEKSIQLEIRDKQLWIDYRMKAVSKITSIQQYSIQGNTLEIKSADRRILVHDLRNDPQNIQKLTDELKRFS